MKILHVADLHLDHAWFDWVASHASDYQLIVLAGDMQNAFSGSGMHDQARAITRWLLQLSVPTIICSGNHDCWVKDVRIQDDLAEAAWIKQLRGQGNILAVDGDTVDFNGLRILVNGWLQRPQTMDAKVDIVVSHAPPAGSPCAFDESDRDHGDPFLWDSLSCAPALLLCGHIHAPRYHYAQRPPKEPTTLVLVPGCDEQSEIPAHWIIDFDARVATHSSGGSIQLPRLHHG